MTEEPHTVPTTGGPDFDDDRLTDDAFRSMVEWSLWLPPPLHVPWTTLPSMRLQPETRDGQLVAASAVAMPASRSVWMTELRYKKLARLLRAYLAKRQADTHTEGERHG